MKEFYLMENMNCGLVYPDAHSSLAYWLHTWLDEKELAKKVCKEIGIEFKDEILEFCAGSMFWAKKDAIRQALELNLTWEDFGKDKHQTGGTLEYVFERLPGLLVKQNGYDIAIYNKDKNVFLLNKGIKLFDRYFQIDVNRAASTLEQFEVITFDIFDTLITRKIYNPDDAFLLMEKRIKNSGIELEESFKELRKKTESNVRKSKNFTR